MRLSRILLSTTVAVLLAGCDHPTTQDALTQLQGGLNEAKQQIGPVADNVSSLTSEQLGKVIRYEYKVLTLPQNASLQEMESILSVAGAERWECFSVVPNQSGHTVFCKRLPYAILRSLLRFM